VLDKDYYLHPTHIICSCHDFDSLEQYFLVDFCEKCNRFQYNDKYLYVYVVIH
jgi:hypothetical protein